MSELTPSKVPTTTAATSKEPVFKIESFAPVFVSSWMKDPGICSICRNQVEGPCVTCQSTADTTTWDCRITWGECGHAFHTHCIQRWLKTRYVCPLDISPWKDKTEWNEAEQ